MFYHGIVVSKLFLKTTATGDFDRHYALSMTSCQTKLSFVNV